MATACGGADPVGSVGAVLGRDGETREIYVREAPDPPPGTSPMNALIPGDQLMMVEGVHVRDLSTKDLRALLRGPPGTEVNLTVIRGSEVLRVRVKRTALTPRLLKGKEERVDEQ